MVGTVDFLSTGSLIRQTGILHARQLFECAPRRLVTLRLRSGLRLTGSVALRLVGARMTNREYGCIFCHSRAWLPRAESRFHSPSSKIDSCRAVLEPPLHRLEACAAENTPAGLQRHSLKIGGDCNRIKQVTLSPVPGAQGAEHAQPCTSSEVIRRAQILPWRLSSRAYHGPQL